jgi:hypothetical protein
MCVSRRTKIKLFILIYQKCYHTSAGNVRCFPERATHRTKPNVAASGFGGGINGRLVDVDCLSGYVHFGITCSKPVDTNVKGTYADATNDCGTQGDMIYFPPNKMQNLVFREAFDHKNLEPGNTVWMGVQRSGAHWIASNGQKITASMANWADGEPIIAGDCVIADASKG